MKKYLALVISLLLVSFASAPALAVTFDLAPFENSDNYEVKFDEMNDTGEISLVEGGRIFGVPEDDDEGIIIGDFDAIIIEGYPPIVRVNLIYAGEDWIFTDNVIIKPADTRYTFEVNRDTDVENGKIYESFTLVMTDESIQMLQDIVDNHVSSVKCRLDGSDRDVDCSLIFDTEKLGIFLDDYRASGSLNNNFALIKEIYPCKIK